MRIKVGSNIYTIKITPKKLMGEDSGDCDTDTLEIRLAKGARFEARRATLLHEVLHAINICLEEKEVEFLAQAFAQV